MFLALSLARKATPDLNFHRMSPSPPIGLCENDNTALENSECLQFIPNRWICILLIDILAVGDRVVAHVTPSGTLLPFKSDSRWSKVCSWRGQAFHLRRHTWRYVRIKPRPSWHQAGEMRSFLLEYVLITISSFLSDSEIQSCVDPSL